MTERLYVLIYRDGKASDAYPWRSVMRLVRQASRLPYPLRVGVVVPAPRIWPRGVGYGARPVDRWAAWLADDPRELSLAAREWRAAGFETYALYLEAYARGERPEPVRRPW